MKINDDIASILKAYYDLPSESLSRFVDLVDEREYPKGAVLYKQGEVAHEIYIVKQGLVRAFAYRGNTPITFWFGRDGELAFPIESVFNGSMEYASMDVLETSSIYAIKVEELLKLYASDIHVANWGRCYAEQACRTAEKLLIDRQFKTTMERYRELLFKCPDIVLRVPLGIIASYLGTTQVNLSRIRARMCERSDL